MAFRYNAQDALSCLPAGEYEVKIDHVQETTSKASGNPMLKVEMIAYGNNGREQKIFEYIVNPATLYKLKQFARALGEMAAFESNGFDLCKHVGARLTAELDVKEDPEYGDKNTITKLSAYSGGVKRPASKAQAATPEITDDDIPF